MQVYKAEYESQNFSFSAYGLSEKEALDVLYMGLEAHRQSYIKPTLVGFDLGDDWYDREDINVNAYNIGSAYRDYSEIYKGE